MSEFNGKLMHQAWMLAPETQKVMLALLADGGDARFVGGCIRNALVNREIIDIDIATPLKPQEVIERLKKAQIKYIPTGIEHGTITAVVDGHPFEITTLRLDVKTDGRHAEVEFTDDWKKDAARRDFTINAMSANINGEVFDPFGGIEDLRNGCVRFIGEAQNRIDEDVLRILRFFRFYAHFGRGEPDQQSFNACVASADKITTLSFERVRQEVFKLLGASSAAKVWRLMVESNIVPRFLPEAVKTDALDKLLELENKCHSQPFVLRRFAILLKTSVDGVKDIAERMRLSKNQMKQLKQMIELAEELAFDVAESKIQELVYRYGSDVTRNTLLLSTANYICQESDFDCGKFEKKYQLATSFRPPAFPLEGKDVLDLGYASGPEVGRLLEEAEAWWIEKKFVPGRSECLKKLAEL